MKNSISRQHIYLFSILSLLLIFVLIFSFGVLIPKGKEYRKDRIEYKKEAKELRRYQDFYNKLETRLKDLQSENRHIITAFDTPFNQYRFQKQHKDYFHSLKLSRLSTANNEVEFSSYEVNATSKISSPKNFYDFLDAVNKSDWIIAVEFPINFKRDKEMIKSNFTMRVYGVNKKINATKEVVE